MGCYEHGDEPLGSVKGGKFLDYLSVLIPEKESVSCC